MSTEPLVIPEPEVSWSLPARGYVGMFGLILAEAAIFTIFIIAYIYNIGKSVTGPQPRDVLRVPVFFTICLWLSSLTIHYAEKALRAGMVRAFMLRWFLTIALGAAFLAGTALEWRHLIYNEGLTIRTNLLLTSGLARFSCDRGPYCVVNGVGFRTSWTREAGTRLPRGCFVTLLALRGCSVGCGVFGCVCRGTVRNWTESEKRR